MDFSAQFIVTCVFVNELITSSQNSDHHFQSIKKTERLKTEPLHRINRQSRRNQ